MVVQSTMNPEAVTEIILSAPDTVTKNKSMALRAIDAGQALLDTIQAEGMSDELDAAVNTYLLKADKTVGVMMAARKQFTQIFDMIKSECTSVEGSIDRKKNGTVPFELQKMRDQYATKKAQEKRQAEQAAQRKLNEDKERAQIKADVEVKLSAYFNEYISLLQTSLNAALNDTTLDSYEQQRKYVANFLSVYPDKHFKAFNPRILNVLVSDADAKKIIDAALEGKYQSLSAEFSRIIGQTKSSILDRFPSRKMELEEMARASADKAAEMKRQAEERAKQEAEELRIANEKRQKEAESQAETMRQAEVTEGLFQAQAAVAEVAPSQASTRESFEIEVLNPLGYLLIAQFYFEHEGKSEDIAKLEKKTLGSMKKYCESYALKHDVQISSPFLKYNEKIKTHARRTS